MRFSKEQLLSLKRSGLDHAWNEKTNLSDKFSFEPPVRFNTARVLSKSSVGAFSYFVSGVIHFSQIGRYCSIAADVNIGPGSHPTNWLSTHPFQFRNDFRFKVGYDFPDAELYHEHVVVKQNERSTHPKNVVVGNDVWIGNGALILPGVVVGDGAIIAARSVVTRDVEPYSIVGGNPAKIIRKRFTDAVIERLLESQWWRFPAWELTGFQFSNVEKTLDGIEEKVAAGNIKPYCPGFKNSVDFL